MLLIGSMPSIAQKGPEIKIGSGIGWFGNEEQWFRAAQVSLTGLYNFSGVVAVGPIYSASIGGNMYFGDNANKAKMNFSELGLVARFTFLRTGKFKFYGSASVAQVKGSYDQQTFVDFGGFTTTVPAKDDTSIGIGVAGGVLFNIGNGFYFNILEYQFRTIKSDFLDMDQVSWERKAGSLSSFKTGISYVFNGD